MREILIQYGMDWDRTMERFCYDESLYAECLTMLLDDPNPRRLRDALESGDLTAAFDAALWHKNHSPFVIQYTILSNKWGAVHFVTGSF